MSIVFLTVLPLFGIVLPLVDYYFYFSFDLKSVLFFVKVYFIHCE